MRHSVQGSEIARMIQRLQKATGADRGLDSHIHAVVRSLIDDATGRDISPYTASEPTCFELIGRVLPGWIWHLGYGVPPRIHQRATFAGRSLVSRRFLLLCPQEPTFLVGSQYDRF